MACKHPIEKIQFNTKEEAWDDEYGSYQSRLDFFLYCTGCKKRVVIDGQRLLRQEVEKFLGRVLSYGEVGLCFKKNPEFFHDISDLDPTLIKLVMSNPKLEKQLEQKRKLIQKHKKEYIALLRKYRGFLSKHDEILLHF